MCACPSRVTTKWKLKQKVPRSICDKVIFLQNKIQNKHFSQQGHLYLIKIEGGFPLLTLFFVY